MPEPLAVSPQPQAFAAAAVKTDVLPVQEPGATDDKLLRRIIIQPKLTVGAPDDPYEKEADAVADKVMRMPEQNFVQRKCAHCEEEKINRKPLLNHATSFIQTKSEKSGSVSDAISDSLESTRGAGAALDSRTQSFMSSRFGSDFNDVKIHTDNNAAQLSRSLNAQAFTVGNDIYFNEGKYAPASESGRHLLAHELTHTIQQSGGIDRKIQRTVDEVVINCADQQIYFSHDGASTSYTLDQCDISDGTYDAGVTLGRNTVDFDLGITPPDTRFDFHYSIAPGQPTPNTFFAGQQRVRIVCTNTPGLAAGGGTFHFNASRITEAEFRSLTGASPDSIPAGVMVPLSNASGGSSRAQRPSILAPATFGASIGYSSPFSFLPSNSTGVLWTQGHTSVWANPESAFMPTLRGYRGALSTYMGEMLPGSLGRNFTIRLHEGVPGSFANDTIFPFTPGEQSYLYVTRSEGEAASFAARLRQTQYGGEYTYSPPRSAADPVLGEVRPTEMELYEILTRRGRAPMCTNNCITVPGAEIDAAIGGLPRTSGGVDVTTGTGPDGSVDPHHRGRGRLMGEATSEGPLSPGVQRLNFTAGATRSMFVIRGAGGIMLVYGIYHTEERVRGAIGTDQLPTVLAEETGSWTGGILGSALGGAAAGAILCAPTGPVDAVCVVGGFLGGLLFGAVGSALGSEVGHATVEGRPPEGGIIDTAVDTIVRPVEEFHNTLDYEIRRLYNFGLPPGMSF